MRLARRFQVPLYPNPITGSAATLVLGPRQTGKSTLLRQQFPEALHLDLLDPAIQANLSVKPGRLRDTVREAKKRVVVLDEIQKAPSLLDEVHWMLENGDWQFVLCASSARKLRRAGTNLLGGRAVPCELFPLTYAEIPNFDLDRYLRNGGLPAHYLREEAGPLLRSYVAMYLQEEVAAEASARNIAVFARFLEIVGLTHGRLMNYSNIARECGVSHHTVRNYFQILKDTLVGFELEAWKRSKSRRLVEASKFYLFDVGIANAAAAELLVPTPGTDAYGRAFENFLLREIQAHYAYARKDLKISFWRTSAGAEVDFILGDMRHAVEVKASLDYSANDLKSLRALREEYPNCKATLVYRGEQSYETEDGIQIQPWRRFLERLGAGEV